MCWPNADCLTYYKKDGRSREYIIVRIRVEQKLLELSYRFSVFANTPRTVGHCQRKDNTLSWIYYIFLEEKRKKTTQFTEIFFSEEKMKTSKYYGIYLYLRVFVENNILHFLQLSPEKNNNFIISYAWKRRAAEC